MARCKIQTLTTLADGSLTVNVPMPTCRLVGALFTIGTLTSGAASITLSSLNRNVLVITHPTANGYYPIGELVDTNAGVASTSYGEGGAVVQGNVTVVVAGGGNVKAGTLALFYES